MLISTKIQLNKEHCEFIKIACRELHYKSLSDYVRDAVRMKVEEDRRALREKKRNAAMELIGTASHENAFESIEGDDFEIR